MPAPVLRSALTDTLEIAYYEHGNPAGPAVLLLHGFPYDPSAFDAVAGALAEQGMRAIVPYLRGYGPTRFLRPAAFRGGEQAAIADDALRLMDAIGVDRFVVCGFDWGGRAACILAALWPDRVRALVAIGGYLIQNIAQATTPAPPAAEQAAWHQFFLATERGRNALRTNRRELTRHLRKQWSPAWSGHDAAFERAAPAFENPDFVDVVAHSYAHRIGAALGETRYLEIEAALSSGPDITVPAIVIRGGSGGLGGAAAPKFRRLIDDRVAAEAGHNPPQETPEIVLGAIVDLVRNGVERS